jgi:TRAP-type C4-dicarboxylate transport system permease small subunit
MTLRSKSVLLFLLDIIELYVPMLAFITIFVCFMLQIVSRYFFTPLMWPEELALIAFLWVALLGALYAKRSNSMVAFSMVYDIASPRVQRLLRIAGSLIIIVALSISFIPSLQYIMFMSYKKSGVLLIPINLAYSCYLIFLVDIIIRYVMDLMHDLRLPAHGGIQ